MGHGLETWLGLAGVILSFWGGLAGIIWVDAWGKTLKKRVGAPPPAAQEAARQEAALRELTRQVEEMKDTSHQFDLSFDAALSRLEARVAHLETRTAPVTGTSPGPEPTVLRNGRAQ